jgi:hypothetical protein
MSLVRPLRRRFLAHPDHTKWPPQALAFSSPTTAATITPTGS